MPRFEDRATRTFVEIVLHGKAVAVREGKRGSKGAVTAKTYPTARAARTAYQKLLSERGGERPAPAEDAAMLAAIAEDPDDDALRMVYADWLQANGNPHGELIALQASSDRKARAKAKALIRKHAAAWLGMLGEVDPPLLEIPEIRLGWRLGFLERVELRQMFVTTDMATNFASLTVARFVKTLVLGGTADYRDAVRVLRATGWPAGLETLSIGHQRRGEFLPETIRLGDVVSAIAKYPQLRRLDLTPGRAKLDHISAPRVQRMTLRDLTPNQLAAVSKASWPALERLGLRLIEARYLGLALAAKWKAPKLRELELHVWREDQCDALATLLARSPMLAKLDRLWLVCNGHYAARLKAAAPQLTIERVPGDDAEIG